MPDRDIDDLVGEWHDSDDPRGLCEYLGMTPWLYKAWVDDPAQFATVGTLEECLERLSAGWSVRCLQVREPLAQQVRSRMGVPGDHHVWFTRAFDLYWHQDVISVDVVPPTNWRGTKDVSFHAFDSDYLGGLRDWLNEVPDA
ncbi:hypothetical protein [Nocardia sp. NPDC051833]|uniref:hypothetical protein n=1 Tax=Nocardia sp. NPDC051833 TaxID=3155674 RepID=UPI00342569A3